MAIMYLLLSALPVTIRSSRGSRPASSSSIATLTSRPSRWPRWALATTVSSWPPQFGGAVMAGGHAVVAQAPFADTLLGRAQPGHVPRLLLAPGVARRVLPVLVERGHLPDVLLRGRPFPGQQRVAGRGRPRPVPQPGQVPVRDGAPIQHPGRLGEARPGTERPAERLTR